MTNLTLLSVYNLLTHRRMNVGFYGCFHASKPILSIRPSFCLQQKHWNFVSESCSQEVYAKEEAFYSDFLRIFPKS